MLPSSFSIVERVVAFGGGRCQAPGANVLQCVARRPLPVNGREPHVALITSNFVHLYFGEKSTHKCETNAVLVGTHATRVYV